MPRRLPRPPLTQNMTQSNGRPNLAWAKWFEQVFRNSSEFAGVAFLAAKGAFTGRSTDGTATLIGSNGLNIASVTRDGVGVYRVTLSQTTAYGEELLNDVTSIVSLNLSPSTTTDSFHSTYDVTDTDEVTISIFELAQDLTASSRRIEMIPYDPDETGDIVEFTILSQLSDELVPA